MRLTLEIPEVNYKRYQQYYRPYIVPDNEPKKTYEQWLAEYRSKYDNRLPGQEEAYNAGQHL